MIFHINCLGSSDARASVLQAGGQWFETQSGYKTFWNPKKEGYRKFEKDFTFCNFMTCRQVENVTVCNREERNSASLTCTF